MTFRPISTSEAIRRIHERDHSEARELLMSYEAEQELIATLESGAIIAGYDDKTCTLAFMKPLTDQN